MADASPLRELGAAERPAPPAWLAQVRMLLGIIGFELRRRRRMLSSYLYFGGLFVLALLVMLMAGGVFTGSALSFGPERSNANAPRFLHLLITVLSHFGLLITAAAFGQAVNQDFEHRSQGIFFTTRVRPLSYLLGRFCAALLFTALVFSALGLGFYAGSLVPSMDPARLGPNRWFSYVWPYLVSVLPNLFFSGAIFFCLGALLRRMAAVYVGAVLLLVGFLVAEGLASNLEHQGLAALLDPLGVHAIGQMTQYWSPAEGKVQLVPFSGALLLNRLLWVGAGAALFGFTCLRFRASQERAEPVRRAAAVAVAAPIPAPALAALEWRAAPAGGRWLGVLARLSWWSFVETVKNAYFAAILLACVVVIYFGAGSIESMYGTPTYPVTREMVELLSGSTELFLWLLAILYSGELVHREREARMDQICDALPLPTWLPFLSKLLSLMLIQVLLLLTAMLTGLGIQTLRGYHNYELGLYLQHLFGLKLVDCWLLAVLCLTVQSCLQNKYVAHFVVMLCFIVRELFETRFPHNLYRYGGTPSYFYSDMNGYGDQLRAVHWFHAYWGVGSLLLLLASYLFWQRGLEQGFLARLRGAAARWTRPWRRATALCAALMAALGGYIFYNTNVLEDYQTAREESGARRDYELKYQRLSAEPQPRIQSIRVAFDFEPERPRLRARGTYQLKNESAAPIGRVYVGLPGAEFERLRVGGAQQPSGRDDELGFYTFDLPESLAAGASIELEFDLSFESKGFSNFKAPTNVVENGSFFSSLELPHVGYDKRHELGPDDIRKRAGLPSKPRMADVNDLQARRNNYISSDADWIQLHTTLSTSPDQIAIAPGELRREWLQDGRRYFEYETPSPVFNYFSVLSARYQVRRDTWNGVALEIYYHPGHEYNLERMLRAMRDTLAYCSSQYGPYPFRQLRIAEFPRYKAFAQSFPATIPFSESAGFVAEVRDEDPDDVDFPYFVTAHEVAHQWWANQVLGGDVQGATFLSESMAEYTALMVMKQSMGLERMKRFLQHEQVHYLRGRGIESQMELPLALVENQPYIQYNKGGAALFALQDYIGEATLNRAARNFLGAVKYQRPPYTTSLELIAQIRKEAPPELSYLIEDLLESITLYENRALSASYRELGGGKYALTLHVQGLKLRADGLGNARPVDMDDLVDVGALDADGVALHLEKRRVGGPDTQIDLVLSARPVKAGIDPLNKLIDRDPDDNVVTVTRAEN